MACPRVLSQSVSLCSRVCRSMVWTVRPGFLKLVKVPTSSLTTQTRTFTCTALQNQGRLFSEEHEWILPDDDKKKGKIGISDHAQDALGEVVYVDLPQVGDKLGKGDSFGVVESVKAASDLYALVDGEVTQVNDALGSSPELVNSDPLGAGWMMEMSIEQPTQLDDLMTEDGYNTFLAESKE